MTAPWGATKLSAALRWAERGWKVFPLVPGTKVPYGGTRGHLDATSDLAEIARLWGLHPEANIGGCTEDRVVIDADLYKDGAQESLQQLGQELGPLPETLTHQTGRGGLQYVFGQNGNPIEGRANIRPGVDTRANGNYIALPPSILDDGGGYPLIDGGLYQVAIDAEPAVIPERWESYLAAPGRGQRRPADPGGSPPRG